MQVIVETGWILVVALIGSNPNNIIDQQGYLYSNRSVCESQVDITREGLAKRYKRNSQIYCIEYPSEN